MTLALEAAGKQKLQEPQEDLKDISKNVNRWRNGNPSYTVVESLQHHSLNNIEKSKYAQ